MDLYEIKKEKDKGDKGDKEEKIGMVGKKEIVESGSEDLYESREEIEIEEWGVNKIWWFFVYFVWSNLWYIKYG